MTDAPPPMTVTCIQRFPVKGLGPESLDAVDVTAGQGLPEDRRFAISHGEVGFNRDAPGWLPKTHFLMLMRNARLAALETRFDAETETLTVLRKGRQVARGCLTQALGRMVIEEFFEAYMKDEIHGALNVLEAPGHMFSDHKNQVLSILNLASVRDLERVVGRPVDPVRFRANLWFESDTPWIEFDWIEHGISVGGTRLFVTQRIDRCAATTVNPHSGERDMNVVKALQAGFGHIDMGVYARVRAGGRITTGDAVTPPKGV